MLFYSHLDSHHEGTGKEGSHERIAARGAKHASNYIFKSHVCNIEFRGTNTCDEVLLLTTTTSTYNGLYFFPPFVLFMYPLFPFFAFISVFPSFTAVSPFSILF